ncbi:hypothetical protein J3R83DRAFT_6121 [Lanmaoa asiatica]|nr:hypothetical protein J3R83DRAFT_6121 [Lanmaoa asiatica]
MALLKEAYRTLSDVGLRAVYDESLLRQEKEHEHEHARSRGPRPAQVVSLEEFTAVEALVTGAETETGLGTEASDAVWQEWLYRCRCGGMYHITEGDLQSGTHLVGCESCSEVIWVGYEEVVVLEDEDG